MGNDEMRKQNVDGISARPIEDQERKIIEVLAKGAIDALYNNCRLKRIKENYNNELGKMYRRERRIFLKKLDK